MAKRSRPGARHPTPGGAAGAGGPSATAKPPEFSDLTPALFRCWLAAAEQGAGRVTAVYLLASLAAAFMIGFLLRFYDLSWLAHALHFNFYVIASAGAVMLALRMPYVLPRHRHALTPEAGKCLPDQVRALAYIEAPILEAAAQARNDTRLLEYLTNSFNDEFNYWNDRLKNVSLIIVAVGVLLGIGASAELSSIAAVLSGWTLFVGLHTSKVTRRGLRYFKHQLFLAGKV